MPSPKRTMPDPNEPGVKDATVTDFLLPYLMGEIPAVKGAMSAMAPAGQMMGKAAPVAEDAAGTAMRDAMMRSMERPAMAEGGVVEEDEMPHRYDGDPSVGGFDVDTGDSSTVKALPLNPASVPPVAPQVSAPPKPPVTPMPAPPVAAAPAARPMPGMPPDVTPDELQKYLGAQKQAIEKYSPDRQYGAEEANLKARTGLPMGIAHAGATFADALMQGVARAGNPGFAKQIEDRNAEIGNAQAAALERARKGTMEQVEAEGKIDLADPGSSMSKAYQQAFAPIFVKMGYDPKAVMRMPASQINTIADLGVRYADAETSQELKRIGLEVQKLTAIATMKNQEAERRQKDVETKKSAAEEVSKHYLLHPFAAHKASQTLEDIASGKAATAPATYTPDVISYAQTHKITPEQAQAIKDKRTGGK